MRIRNASIHDEEDILHIHQKAVEAGCKHNYSKNQIASWANPEGLPPFVEQLQSSWFLIVEHDGKTVGFGSVCRDKPEIETLFIHPDYFRQGLGSKLLKALEKTAANTSQIFVDSSLNAIPFYERHGYHRLCKAQHTEPDGTELECLRMVKSTLNTKAHG